MVNITHKITTLRKAIATARVQVSQQATIDAIQNRTVPKGDVFEFGRAAGLLAIKKTSDVIPDCHPLPVEYAAIQYAVEGLAIIISVEVHAIYRTGVEVEAMHGAAITALTLYDMLKPIDQEVAITHVKLASKQGGKSDNQALNLSIKTAVVVCSDTLAAGKGTDESGKAVVAQLARHHIAVADVAIIPDDVATIQQKALELVGADYQMVLFCGGTGLSPRDVTPDALLPLMQRPVPGIMEAARSYGQERMPYAMLSRGVAGFINQTLVLTLPGSKRGAIETLDAVFPYVTHVFKVAAGMRHD